MELITTTHGEVPRDQLDVLQGTDSDANADVHWTEYRLISTQELVRRDAHVVIKKGLTLFGEQGTAGA